MFGDHNLEGSVKEKESERQGFWSSANLRSPPPTPQK